MAMILNGGLSVAPRETVVREIYGRDIPVSGLIEPINSHISEPIDTTPAIPQVVTDFLTQAPIISQVGLVTDLWGLLLGSPEQKAETVLPYLPITPQATTQIQEEVIAPMVASGEWATTPTLPTGQTFEMPDILGILGEAGKWVLIGGAALLGLYIVTRKK